MIPDSQKDVFAFLADPATHGVEAVEEHHTHISAIVLAGDKAYKLKREVDLGFVDFTTLEKRKEACEKEARINAVAAPELYLGVKAITKQKDGGLMFDGPGTPLDYVVEMKRFAQDDLLDAVLKRGEVDRHMMTEVGRAIARFHDKAEVFTARGGAVAMRATIEGNKQSFLRHTDTAFDARDVEVLINGQLAELNARAELMGKRRDQGKVRRCHGDLHLNNICLVDGTPTLFDAIEFNDAFAIIDVLYDLAFLIMDLESRGKRGLANTLLNAYLPYADELDGLALLPLFLSTRASIRSHVSAAMAKTQSSSLDHQRLNEFAGAYMVQAQVYLEENPPMLVAVGGFSGSGKSRMGRELAPFMGRAPGAVVLRTDVIRKRLMGVDPEEALPPEAYSAEMSRKTYDVLYDMARRALAAGQAVVADAVFAKPEEREAIENIARDAEVPFAGLWLEAPRDVMAERIEARERNASDATVAVLDKQLQMDLGPLTWTRIDSSGPREETVAAGCAAAGL